MSAPPKDSHSTQELIGCRIPAGKIGHAFALFGGVQRELRPAFKPRGRRAVSFVFRKLKLGVEPGGAIGLAALLAGRLDVKDKVVVAVLSGGNVDPELFHRLVA